MAVAGNDTPTSITHANIASTRTRREDRMQATGDEEDMARELIPGLRSDSTAWLWASRERACASSQRYSA
ncbi:hypothetical protein GCM10007863_41350 [Dyella mobilis]|nr:hypothetical protein GCM10007863_41350 [Dyella mobilis]